jgi:glycosyltransferase involved in cell wall biosynthesis
MAKILYITYDGLMDPLGMSQVWQYIKVLSKKHSITIVSFEKKKNLSDKDRLISLADEVKSFGVSWHRLTYHKRPNVIATFYDVVFGISLSFFLVRKNKIKIIHSRSYVPALVALIINRLLGIKFIFDMRGFWADEKVDGGIWSKDSLIYRVTKNLERIFFLRASHIVSLTNTGRSDILSLDYMKNLKNEVTVIPTCVNLALFKPKQPVSDNVSDLKTHFTLGYVGSIGTFYLFDEVLKSFQILLKIMDNAKLLIINKDQHDLIYNRVASFGISRDCIEVKSVLYDKVSTEINRMDAGIFYIKPLFSKRSSSPTKFGEFLGCGKPCISNFGVGDTESVLNKENVGVVLKNFSDNEHVEGVKKILKLVREKDVQKRCVRVAKEYFSLEIGVNKYNNIYKKLEYTK